MAVTNGFIFQARRDIADLRRLLRTQNAHIARPSPAKEKQTTKKEDSDGKAKVVKKGKVRCYFLNIMPVIFLFFR